MTMAEYDLDHMQLGLEALSLVSKHARESERPGLGNSWATTVELIVAAMTRAAAGGRHEEVSDLAWHLVRKAHRAPGNPECPASIAAARAVVAEFIDGWPEWLAPYGRK